MYNRITEQERNKITKKKISPTRKSMVGQPTPFEELLSRCRQGDQEAMQQLAREYERELRIVAKARVGVALRPYVDSVDLVQSVHRSLLIGLRNNKFNIASPDQLIALALTIVRRKAARHWRKFRRQRRLSGGHDATANLAELLVNLSRPPNDPHQLVANTDIIERILREIDDVDRAIIELRLEGYSTVDAANQLGLNPDVTRVRLSRMRTKLKQSGIAEDLI